MRIALRLSLCLVLTSLASCSVQVGAPGEPRAAEDHSKRGISLAEKGDLDGAIAEFTKAIEANPRDAQAYYNRGLGRGKKAIRTARLRTTPKPSN